MSSTVPASPVAAAREPRAGARLAALKLRAALVGVTLTACALAGYRLVQAPLTTAVSGLWQSALGQRALPAPHVPLAVDDAGWRGLVELAVLGIVTGAMLIAHAYGRTGRISPRWLLLPTLLLPLVFAWLSPPTRGVLPFVPGPLERDILAGRGAAAEERMAAAETLRPVREYVLAQAALRAGDAALIGRHGSALLDLSDRVAYGLAVSDDLRMGLDYRPEVVLAVDRAIHGEPQSEIGIRLRGMAGEGGPQAAGLPAGRLLAGVALLAAAATLWRLWTLMCARITTIAAQLDEQAFLRTVAGPRVAEAPFPEPAIAPVAE